MSYRNFDLFNYIDIKPQNYNFKQNLVSDLEEISKTLENIIIDWKERESSIQFIGRIAKGNLGKSDYFIKYFNTKLSTLLEIQLCDLRSSVMKEACRITSLCAKELKLLIEQGITNLLSQNCLFKIAGSANKVISDSASKCILNILSYVHSIKVISNICEIKTMKANNVRILCAQSLVNIMSFYDTNIIIKAKDILEEAINTLLVDANAEVRATTRKSFILYKSRFDTDAQKIFEKLGKNVQKQILEDEKNFDKLMIKSDFDGSENLVKKVNKLLDENLSKINQNDLIPKPRTPEVRLFKKHSFQDLTRKDKNKIVISNKKMRKSVTKDRKNYLLDTEKDKKEETVKYINMDDDDIAEDDIEEDKKGPEDSIEVNMVFNYSTKNKNKNKMSFNKRNKNKNNDKSTFSNNINVIEAKNFDNKETIKIKKDRVKTEINDLAKTQDINPFLKLNQEGDNLIDELIINSDNKNENNLLKSENISNNNGIRISNASSNLNPEKVSKHYSNKKIKSSITRITEKMKSNQNSKNNKEINIPLDNDKKSKILKKFNSKFDSLNAFNNKIIKKPNKKQEKIVEKKTNKKINDKNNNSKNNNKLVIKNSKTVDYNDKKTYIDINDEKNENKLKEKNDIVEIILADNDNDLEEEIDAVINLDKIRGKNKNSNNKAIELNKNNKNNEDKKYNYSFNKPSKNNNINKDKKIKNNQELYDEINQMSSDKKNEELILNNEDLEQKLNFIIDKLDNLINQNEKLILFQYLFNYFNSIFTEIKNFSNDTIRRYIDIHIDNLKENDTNLLEQVIKNLMRMIFYLKDIFSSYDIELILRILLFSINNINMKTLKKLSYDLLEIIKKKYDNEELFQSVYSLLGECKTSYDECYDFMYMLIPSCDKILKNSNYFKQVFRLICLTDINSKKVGKIIDILYRKYRNNFNQAFDEETSENKKQILMFMEKFNSLYFLEFKSKHENNLINDNNTNTNSSNNYDELNNNSHQIIISTIPQKRQNSENIDSDNMINNKKSNSFSNKTSETNINSVSNTNVKSMSNKSNNIILNQIPKNNNNINSISTNLNGNNIISINNSNNNNIIITNKVEVDSIPTEINQAIKNNDIEQYMLYIKKHKSYIPEFILLLSNKKYSEQSYAFTLLNFTKNILNSSDFSIDLNTCINLMIKQIIYIFNLHKNNENIQELIKNILSDMPIFLNSEKCLSSMAKFLTSDTDNEILEILILSLESFCLNYYKKIEEVNKERKPLQNLLDNFITELFNLLKHQNSEIRKRALFCCVDIYTVIGKELDNFISKLPNAQQNLIRLYIKKRVG